MNKRCQIAFDKYIEELNKPKTYGGSYGGSYGGGYGGCYGRQPGTPLTNSNYTPPTYDDCTIFFYEWSNLRMGAKHFNKKEDFFKFLNESNINFTDSQKEDIIKTRYKNIFATCVPNKPQLLTADTWYNLNTVVNTYLSVSTPMN